jgi:hypothetical protein
MDSSSNSYETNPSLYGRLLQGAINVIEILLGFRFALKFIGSDPHVGLNLYIYKITQPFAAPFLKALGIYKEEGSVLEWTTLVAMVIYWIIAWLIIKIFLTDDTVSTAESEKKFK